ncbi:MAG: UDP-N-acetylmuramoyl-L-alanyl-D-glutamate--2,6-diaminopimelate ligase [Gammaproteobacteria bacterium]
MYPHTLATLLADYRINAPEIPIAGLAVDSRTMKKGEVFLAYPGTDSDGRNYIEAAIQQGAAAVLYEPDTGIELPNDIPLIPMVGLREHVGALAARWFNYPTRHLKIFGVTGTNGKTSCTHYLAQALSALGNACGVLGTLGTGFPSQLQTSQLTTPGALAVQQITTDLLNQGAKALAMEVSSHAIVQGRVNCVHFNTAIFTNLTQDHLDYHHTMSAYGAAKAQLFQWPSLQHAVINLDDAFGYALFLELQQQVILDVIGYTTVGHSDLPAKQMVQAINIVDDQHGLQADVLTPWGKGHLRCSLLGRFNLENVLAVLTALCANGIALGHALAAIEGLSAVPGRLQCFGGKDQPLVVVDYAHTPDALQKALATLRAYQPNKLTCVFGCGGDRDPTKRSLMGSVAAEFSDVVIITNDNPRTEDPKKIIADIQKGIPLHKHIKVECDRAKAIEMAIQAAQAGDIVLIAGKGHEDYQIIGKQRLHFSDAEVVNMVLNCR